MNKVKPAREVVLRVHRGLPGGRAAAEQLTARLTPRDSIPGCDRRADHDQECYATVGGQSYSPASGRRTSKRAPFAQVVRRHRAVVGLHQPRRDRQPQTGTAWQRRVRARHPAVGPAVGDVEHPRPGRPRRCRRRCRRRAPTRRSRRTRCASSTVPPSGVWAIALATRLDSTRTSARSLPITRTGWSGSPRVQRDARRVRRRCGARPSRRRRPRRAPPCRRRAGSAPALIFDISNRSSTISESRIVSCSMCLACAAHLVVGDHAVGDRLGDRADAGQRRAQVMADERDQPSARLLGGALGVADLLLPHGAAGLVAGQHDRGGDGHDRHDDQHDGDAARTSR